MPAVGLLHHAVERILPEGLADDSASDTSEIASGSAGRLRPLLGSRSGSDSDYDPRERSEKNSEDERSQGLEPESETDAQEESNCDHEDANGEQQIMSGEENAVPVAEQVLPPVFDTSQLPNLAEGTVSPAAVRKKAKMKKPKKGKKETSTSFDGAPPVPF